MPIFDIPSSRLVDLTDEDLRELVARLCEAERERQGGSRNEVRWGGSQTAADGGLDVVVEPVGLFLATSPLMRRDVGIQVKAADLAAAAISAEMLYGGALRPAISALAAKNGAYLIVSAGANCSEAMLKRRIASMRAAVADDPNGGDLAQDFLDRNAISRWVSTHPSVAAWLRRRLTLPLLEGWHPYGRWSSTPEGEADDLICEAGLTFHIGRDAPIRSLPDALDAIRILIRDGIGSVRMAGLSGIGKSRIVQALFEPVGGVAPLPATHAIYTDLGHSPNPTPMGMLDALIERDVPAILVVDNCPPDTHQALARKLAQRPGPVRLITVEYDVRIDRPEATNVIRVEAEGPEIVEALLLRRRKNLSSADARRLAELAQGNARLGFALAQAAPQTGTLSAFEDAVLFERLFWQRGQLNEELARAAEVLSLVYSFEVDGDEIPDELTFLGSLADLSRGTMHRHATSLLDRGLAQARSRWRAVLPHALANRLARQALRAMSWKAIADGFADKPRLRQSLARRLSYLHDSDEARRVVIRWMEPGGPLHGDEPDVQLLEAICHLVPSEALDVVERIIARFYGAPEDFLHRDSLTRIITRTAHAEEFLPRTCDLLFTLATKGDERWAAVADSVLNSLFGLYLSGTLAQTEVRTRVARTYLQSHDVSHCARGIVMLRSALHSDGWSSSFLSYDDARLNAFGWEPNHKEAICWFACWLDLALEIALSAPSAVRKSVRQVLADEISNIWQRVPLLRGKIDDISRQLHASAPWVEGCHSLRRMLHLINRRGDKLPERHLAAVRELIEHMAPTDLKTTLRAEIATGWDYDSDDEDYAIAEKRRSERLELLGEQLANSLDDLAAMGRDLLESSGRSLYYLGTGLANGGQQPQVVWGIVRDLYLADPSKSQQSSILSGFMHRLDETDPPAAEAIRDECRSEPALRREYAIFLPKGTLPLNELKNVIEITEEIETEAWQLTDIVWREERGLDDQSRVSLLRALMKRRNGPHLVIDALNMLHFVEKGARNVWPNDLRAVGIDAVSAIVESQQINNNLDHDASRTLSYCLPGDNGSDAHRVLDTIIARASHRYGSTYDVKATLGVISHQAPRIFLDRLLPDGSQRLPVRFDRNLGAPSLSRIPHETLIEWCNENPDRWLRVAHLVMPFSRQGDDEQEIGLSSLATALLEAAPQPEKLVEAYLQHLAPMSWSGSRADIMEHRLAKVELLKHHYSPEVGLTITRLAPAIRSRISDMRRAEQDEDRERDERFE